MMEIIFYCIWGMCHLQVHFEWDLNCKDINQILFPQMSPWEALKSELLFAINIRMVTKPVHGKLSEAGTGSSRSRLQLESETHSLKEKSESLHFIKIDNNSTENEKADENGGSKNSKERTASRSLLNLNKILDLKRSAT